MYDHNVFAVLTADDQRNKARSAFKLPENSRWFREAVGGVAEAPTINSREATPAEDTQSENEAYAGDRLVITFDKLTDNLQNGIQAGTDPISSHILLGHRGTKGISAKQYSITVNDDLWIWLRDYDSAFGTAVSHNNQNQKEVRKKETWILAYQPGVPNRFGDITIYSGSLSIKIEFPNHEAANPRYVENLRAFAKRCKKAAEKSKEEVPVVERLGLDSEPTTQAPSDAQTPGARPVYYNDGSIGEGAFGEVHRAIRMSDGRFLAAKMFKKPSTNKRKRNKAGPTWLTGIRREFSLMKDNPHVSPIAVSTSTTTLIIEQANVMRVFEFRETPEPMIVMAYYPDGNLADANIADENTYVSAFGQILDGLGHLHLNGVVHRDLKPENFLIRKKPYFTVVITDFGLSKVVTDTTLLITFCGTFKYTAPEVFPGLGDGHGTPVDIWSLGVITFEWIYGIPTLPNTPQLESEGAQVPSEQWYMWVTAWCNKLSRQLDNEDDDQVVEILLRMIKFDVAKRWRATECLAKGFKNGLFQRRAADGLVCASDRDDLVPPGVEGDDGAGTLTAASSLQQIQAGLTPKLPSY